MASPHHPRQNHILAALPDEDFNRLRPDLELIPMPLEWALRETPGKPGHVYFPTSSVVSLLHATEHGSSAEIAASGNEGMVGITLFLGSEAMPNRSVVRCAGYGYQLRSAILKREIASNSPLCWLALRYAQTLVAQMTHTAICNRDHSVEQQMCRWMLLSLDRLHSDELKMTPDLIGSMLGAQREKVAAAAGRLQDAGLMHYARGQFTVTDRSRIEQCACECYGQIKKEAARLQPAMIA